MINLPIGSGRSVKCERTMLFNLCWDFEKKLAPHKREDGLAKWAYPHEALAHLLGVPIFDLIDEYGDFNEQHSLYRVFRSDPSWSDDKIRCLIVQDNVYDYSEDEAKTFYRDPKDIAISFHKLAGEFYRESDIYKLLMQFFMDKNKNSNRDHILDWMNRTSEALPLIDKNDISEYIALCLDNVANLFTVYNNMEVGKMKIRIAPNIGDLVRERFKNPLLY